MEPSSESPTNWNLPQPAGVEQRPHVEPLNNPLERGAAEVYSNPGVERGSMPMPPQFSVPQPPVVSQLASQDAGLATTSVTPTTVDNGSLAAADNDRIEKEWVERAKKVVEQARQDPYLQTQSFTELKASYLQKRYNKTLKVSE